MAGLDEAGRGPLAGPVVATAVNIGGGASDNLIRNLKVKDSKQLTARQREYFYKLIIKNRNIKWGIGIVSEKIIDKINILEATKLAMAKAIKSLESKLEEISPPKIDYLILDGNMKLNIDIPQKSIVKGDEKVFSCALASIIAKVIRDRVMIKYHKRYPQYHFHLNKGYGTRFHFRILEKKGPCLIHRKSFYPVYACKYK